MASSKIDNVNVVSDGGSVARGVVYRKKCISFDIARCASQAQSKGIPSLTLSVDQELLALACGNLSQQGEQVERNALRILAHDAAGVGTAGVEVAQQSAVPLLERLALLLQVVALSVDVVRDDVLNHGLGAAVGVGRANGAVLGDGDHVGESSRIAVDGGGGGEDNVGDIVAGHGLEEGNAAANIDAVVFERDHGRLSDGLEHG